MEKWCVRGEIYGSTIGTRLSIVARSQDEPIAFDPPPFSLRTQPQRPGELTELIDVPLDAAVARHVRKAAAGLPLELAVYIAIEAERALAEAMDLVAASRAEMSAFLDAAAADAVERAPRNVLVRPLQEYAAALRRGLPDDEVVDTPLRARVPHRTAASWAHAAASAGVPLDRWVADTVAHASLDRAPWEAAAADFGRTLAEWVLLQAARCARSRSTSPQTTACG